MAVAHSHLSHALARAINQRRQIGTLHAPHRQKLLLRGNPVRHVELNQCLSFGDTIERGPHMQAFDVASGARLHNHLIALVVGDAAHGRYLWREHAFGDGCGAHTEILLDARTDGDLALIGVTLGVNRHQHHVHERRLGGLVKLVSGHHRVVVIQDFLARFGVHVTGFNTRCDVAFGGRFSLSNALRARIDAAGGS